MIRFGLRNSFLQESDMAGVGQRILDLGGLQIGYKTTTEVCIGVRTSGKTGSGSYDDPFAANTRAQFDALMATYASVSGKIIRIRDGTFQTFGNNAWGLAPGVQIIGEGIGATILQIDPAVGPSINGGIFVINALNTVDGNGQLVEGMTLDCNYQNLVTPPSAMSANGVVLYGSNIKIRSVKVTNPFGRLSTNSENFAILIQFTSGNVCVAPTVEDCIVEDFLGDYGNAIGVIGDGSGNNINRGGGIFNCRVKNYWPNGGAGDLNASHAVAFALGGPPLVNCYANHCGTGAYSEIAIDQKIIGNTFHDIYNPGIYLQPTNSDILRPIITDNTIEMRDDPPSATAFLLSQASTFRVRSGLIQGNRCYTKVTGNTPGVLPISVQLFSDTGLGHMILGNTFPSTWTASKPSDTTVRDNRSPSGAVLAGLPDPSIAAGANFSAIGSGSGGQSLSDMTFTKLLFNTEQWDIGSHFSGSRFTAPIDGKYSFNAQVQTDPNANFSEILLYKNGSALRGGWVLDSGSSATQIITLIGTATLDLLAGDYIELFGYQNSTGPLLFYINAAGGLFQGLQL